MPHLGWVGVRIKRLSQLRDKHRNKTDTLFDKHKNRSKQIYPSKQMHPSKLPRQKKRRSSTTPSPKPSHHLQTIPSPSLESRSALPLHPNSPKPAPQPRRKPRHPNPRLPRRKAAAPPRKTLSRRRPRPSWLPSRRLLRRRRSLPPRQRRQKTNPLRRRLHRRTESAGSLESWQGLILRILRRRRRHRASWRRGGLWLRRGGWGGEVEGWWIMVERDALPYPNGLS